MTLRKRLDRLESLAGPPNRRPFDLLFLDTAGRIMADGSPEIAPWAGQHISALPQDWLAEPWALKCIVGIDPIECFGQPRPAREV